MTNKDKYNDATERAEAFWRDYRGRNTPDEAVLGFSKWLDLEAPEEEPLPCPFCGGDVEPILRNGTEVGFSYLVSCKTCSYKSRAYRNRDEAIASHNRMAKVVMYKETN